jgi:hypothetical protein
MKLSELRQIIKEELEGVLGTDPTEIPGALAMARPAEGYKLTDNWESILTAAAEAAKDKSIKDKYMRYMGLLKSVASEPYFKFPQLFGGGYTPVKAELLSMGVVEPAGVRLGKSGLFSPAEKPASSGVMGRPKTIDDAKKMLGLGVTMKYAKGSMDFSPEEVEFIKTLYKSIKGK